MKQPKKLTRTQKECLSRNGIDWHEWSLIDETDNDYLIVNKNTRKELVVSKHRRRRRDGLSSV